MLAPIRPKPTIAICMLCLASMCRESLPWNSIYLFEWRREMRAAGARAMVDSCRVRGLGRAAGCGRYINDDDDRCARACAADASADSLPGDAGERGCRSRQHPAFFHEQGQDADSGAELCVLAAGGGAGAGLDLSH